MFKKEEASLAELKAQAAIEDSLLNFEKSISLYTRMLELDTSRSNQIISLAKRGYAKIELGDTTGGIVDLDMAISIKPIYKTVITRGLIELNRNPKNALKYFYVAKSLEADDVMVDYPLLHYYTLIDFNADSSLHYADYLFGKKPEYEKGIYMMLMNAYLNNSEYKKLIMTSDSIIVYETDNAFAYNNRGFAKMNLGDLTSAKKDIVQSLKVNPKNSFAYKNLGLLYIKTNHMDSACVSLSTAKNLGYRNNFGPEVDDLMARYCK